MENNNYAVKNKGLTKEYKMFSRKKDRLLELIFPFYNKHTLFRAVDD